MDQNKIPVREIIFLTLGEIITGIIICLVFLILKKFDYTVPLGALLGGGITVLNFLFLCISVNRAFDKVLEGADFTNAITATESQNTPAELSNERDFSGDSELDGDGTEENISDDAAAAFARANQMKVQNAIKLSYIVRTVTIAAVIIAAVTTHVFNLIATLIPLVMFRPLLNISALIKRKEK